MNELAEELFNILKGANYKLRLFTAEGIKTLQPEEATRFYAYDQDLMVTLRKEDAKTEILVQAGQEYDIPGNRRLLDSIKSVAHKNLGEYTVRKFDKKIAPKDFAHQSVVQEGFSKPFGSIKTSYIKMPEARLIIKHTKGVNEEVRGARSRNIHALFIENSQGEKFRFPHRYMSGAKAMAMHVNEGGTPYDATGEAILAMCEEISALNKFLKHVKGNNLMNETNGDIVEAVSDKLNGYKNTINSLSTVRGYNSFQVQENNEDTKNNVDITEKFLYNTVTTEEMKNIFSKVGSIVAERNERDSSEKSAIKGLYDCILNNTHGITIMENDPEHPAFLQNVSEEARLAATLSYLANLSENEDTVKHLTGLSEMINNGMLPNNRAMVEKMVTYLESVDNEQGETSSVALDEDIMLELRKRIS